MSFDIFVSYSTKDKVVADAIVSALEIKNIRCWYAPRDIKPGANWAESITDAIQQCNIFLLIFSSNSNQSTHVLDEVSYAISEEKMIIPFRIENLDPAGALRLHIRHKQNDLVTELSECLTDLHNLNAVGVWRRDARHGDGEDFHLRLCCMQKYWA